MLSITIIIDKKFQWSLLIKQILVNLYLVKNVFSLGLNQIKTSRCRYLKLS